MTSGDSFQLPTEPDRAPFPLRPILFVVGVVVVLALIVWGFSDSAETKQKKAELVALQATLATQQTAVAAEKEKITMLSTQLDNMKMELQTSTKKDINDKIKTYNQLAAEQRSERDKYLAMVADYQTTVNKINDLNP